MPAKPVFNEEQQQILHDTVLRVWKRFKAGRKSQEELALALGITQQTVSNFIRGTYSPGEKVARGLANLDGKTLEQLLGEDFFTTAPPEKAHGGGGGGGGDYPKLNKCIEFYEGTKNWSPWTLAAARAGFFGATDYPPPEWVGKLDTLEALLAKGRKAV